MASGGLSHFRVDEELDAEVVRALRDSDLTALAALEPHRLQGGSSEIRNWICVAAAVAEAGLALLAMRPADPGKYGRVVTNAAGDVERIVEWADASEAERGIGLCNAGVVCAPAPALLRWLGFDDPNVAGRVGQYNRGRARGGGDDDALARPNVDAQLTGGGEEDEEENERRSLT